jgi:hypothetical protein
VIDSATGSAFCDGDNLVNPAYAGKTNAAIAHSSSGIFDTSAELYAQSFAYQGFANSLSYTTFGESTADGLFFNGQWPCAQYQASLRLGGEVPACGATPQTKKK